MQTLNATTLLLYFDRRLDVNIHHRNNTYLSTNVFGAVSTTIQKRVYVWVSDGIKQDRYRAFLRKLKSEVRVDVGTKPILFYDGLKSHDTVDSLRVAN